MYQNIEEFELATDSHSLSPSYTLTSNKNWGSVHTFKKWNLVTIQSFKAIFQVIFMSVEVLHATITYVVSGFHSEHAILKLVLVWQVSYWFEQGFSYSS